jgi:hypothetical protein
VVYKRIIQSKLSTVHDLLEATKESKTIIELLRAERRDESVWAELYQSALDLSEPFDIVENMPSDVEDRLPEPITLQTGQNSIGKFLCTMSV